MTQPYYYKGERGNKPYVLDLMLHLHILQNLYDLFGWDNVSGSNRQPSIFQVLWCRIQQSGVARGYYRSVQEYPRKTWLAGKAVHAGSDLVDRTRIDSEKRTIVDSTLISAPSSTKNKEKKRDPDAHSVKKGNTWHLGYRTHVGVDKDTGLVHHVEVTSANIHDVTMAPRLLSREETTVCGDSGYLGAGKREDALRQNKQGKQIRYKANRRPSQSKSRSVRSHAQIKRREHGKSSVRAKAEHIFAVVKGLFHFRKTRFRGLWKQTEKLNMMVALVNLYLVDKRGLLADLSCLRQTSERWSEAIVPSCVYPVSSCLFMRRCLKSIVSIS